MKRARALTLIEVVASLALVAASVTALLQVQSRVLVQLHSLREQQTASDLARGLIMEWRLQDSSLPIADRGEFQSEPGWSWTRTVEPYWAAQKLPLDRIELRICRADAGGGRELANLVWLEERHVPSK